MKKHCVYPGNFFISMLGRYVSRTLVSINFLVSTGSHEITVLYKYSILHSRVNEFIYSILANKRVSQLGRHFLTMLVQSSEKPVLAGCRFGMIPFFDVACNLVGVIELERKKRVDWLGSPEMIRRDFGDKHTTYFSWACRLAISKICDILVNQKHVLCHRRRIGKNTEFGNVGAREKL